TIAAITMTGDDAMSPSPKDQIDLRSLVLLAFSATAGVLVEYYDFFIFGYGAASAFPKIFFPDLSPTLALVSSFLIFGAAAAGSVHFRPLWGSGRQEEFLPDQPTHGGHRNLSDRPPARLRDLWRRGAGSPDGIVDHPGHRGASSLLAEFAAKRKHRAFWM